ncbi:hypothetical protein IKF57_02760, partial [Candidatus Saccharibacteria bacterium]|nr:hypothetical protein [Candidatus Saccharibacteria bacterium]
LLKNVSRYDFQIYSVYIDKTNYKRILPVLDKAKLALSRFMGQASIRTLFEPASFITNDSTKFSKTQHKHTTPFYGIITL